jgi:methionine-rich copper-binding protein CopC
MRVILLSLTLMVAAALAGAAAAHAMLERASPAVGSRLAASPREVRLSFSQALVAAFSSFTLTGADGRVVAGRPHVDPSDPTQLVLPLKRPLAPGRYQVKWRVVSVDTHVTEGDFSFSVGP